MSDIERVVPLKPGPGLDITVFPELASPPGLEFAHGAEELPLQEDPHTLTRGARVSRRSVIVGAAAVTPFVVSPWARGMASLGANLLATKLEAPDAPLELETITDPHLKRVAMLYNNLVTNFGTHDALLLEENRDTSTRYARVWTYSRALDALNIVRHLPGALRAATTTRLTA